MELSRLLDELTRAAAKAGIDVRMESFDPNLSDARNPRGGLCVIRGRRVILVDAGLPLPDRIATLAGALARVDLDAVYMPPIVRATIGAYATPEQAHPDAPAEARPVLRVVSPSQGKRPAKPRRPRVATRPLPPVRARWRDEDDEDR